MAKALIGHLAALPDPLLLADLRAAHRRIGELEEELARTREANEALVGSLQLPSGYTSDGFVQEPAYS